MKRLEQVSDDGLEQWRPVAKAEFPIAAAGVASLLSALGVESPALARDAFELDELVEVVSQSSDLIVVPVHKRRAHYTFGGCAAELTEVRTDALTTRTIAVESEDPALVRAALRTLELESQPNVSFPRGLMALVGFGARRYAVVDVGTNSVKFHLAERAADGRWRQLVDRAEVTRLGEGLDDSGRLQPEPMERTIEAIAGMAEEGRAHGAEAIAAVGTAGLRVAGNSADFVDAVHTRCGVRVEVITGDEEARLSYLAATAGIGPVDGSLVVVRDRRRQHAVHLRPWRPYRRAVQHRCRCCAGSPSGSVSTASSTTALLPQRSTRLQEHSGRSTDAPCPTLWWGWAEP